MTQNLYYSVTKGAGFPIIIGVSRPSVLSTSPSGLMRILA